MNIQEDYVSYEVAKLLKEKGFDSPCMGRYSIRSKEFHLDCTKMCNNGGLVECAAPSQAMAMRWLREKDIYVCPKYCCFCGSKKKDVPYFLWEPRILRLSTGNIIYPQPLDMCKHYNSYEEAVEAALKYSLENLI